MVTLLAAALATFAVPGAARADSTIDTIGSWNGTDYVYPFGVPDTSTYGQTITVPAGETSLSSFTFELQQPSDLVFRGEVYAWDAANHRATGPSLYESGQRHTSQGTEYEEVTFNTGAIPVTPGNQYVIFASTSRDDGQIAPGTGNWGTVADSAYTGGTFVYENNEEDESQWTSRSWIDNYGVDTAFRAVFGTPAITGLDPSISGLAQVGQTLTANAGPVDPADSTLSYQWKADGTNISGATSSTLLLTPDLAGARIKVRIKATHAGLDPETGTSAATPYVRELVKKPRVVLGQTVVCPGSGPVTGTGQGLVPGNTYTIHYLKTTLTRTADVYGEVQFPVDVPAGTNWGPHVDTSVAISGAHPTTNASALLLLNCTT